MNVPGSQESIAGWLALFYNNLRASTKAIIVCGSLVLFLPVIYHFSLYRRKMIDNGQEQAMPA
jgi:hypothetical protein